MLLRFFEGVPFDVSHLLFPINERSVFLTAFDSGFVSHGRKVLERSFILASCVADIVATPADACVYSGMFVSV